MSVTYFIDTDPIAWLAGCWAWGIVLGVVWRFCIEAGRRRRRL